MYGALGTVAKLMMGTALLPVDDVSGGDLSTSSSLRRKAKRPRLSGSASAPRDASHPEGRALHVVELSQEMNSQIDHESSGSEDEEPGREEVRGSGSACDGRFHRHSRGVWCGVLPVWCVCVVWPVPTLHCTPCFVCHPHAPPTLTRAPTLV